MKVMGKTAKTIDWKVIHDKLIKNDVDWLSLDSFRVWLYVVDPYEGMNDPGQLKQLELTSIEFIIKPTQEGKRLIRYKTRHAYCRHCDKWMFGIS